MKSLKRGGGGIYAASHINKQTTKEKKEEKKTDQCLCEFTPGLRKDVTLSGMGSPGSNMSMVDIHLRKLLWVYSHTGVKGLDRADRLAGKKATFTNDPAHRLAGKATLTNDPAHRLAGNATLTNDRAHRLAGKAALTNGPAHRLAGKAALTSGDTTCGDKPEDITPSIGWRREAWKEKALDDLP